VQFGRYYEEFEVGAVYKHWPGKTVTEYDDHLFCLLTMNHHPLHLDAHYAQETTDFKRNVVVGNYVYSLLLGMSVADRADRTSRGGSRRRGRRARQPPVGVCGDPPARPTDRAGTGR
jgi:acyl dehydratase